MACRKERPAPPHDSVDVVADEHHALLARRRGTELGVGAAVTRQAAPISQQLFVEGELLIGR